METIRACVGTRHAKGTPACLDARLPATTVRPHGTRPHQYQAHQAHQLFQTLGCMHATLPGVVALTLRAAVALSTEPWKSSQPSGSCSGNVHRSTRKSVWSTKKSGVWSSCCSSTVTSSSPCAGLRAGLPRSFLPASASCVASKNNALPGSSASTISSTPPITSACPRAPQEMVSQRCSASSAGWECESAPAAPYTERRSVSYWESASRRCATDDIGRGGSSLSRNTFTRRGLRRIKKVGTRACGGGGLGVSEQGRVVCMCAGLGVAIAVTVAAHAHRYGC